MDKIKEAQKLAEKLLDEACICQVGDDKGALKDKPESIKKSEEDIKKAVKMEAPEISKMIDDISSYMGEGKDSKFSTDNRLQSILHRAIYNKMKRKNRKAKPLEESKKMSAERIARREKMLKDLKNFVKLKKKPIKESEIKERDKILSMVDNLGAYLGEGKEVKVSDVPKDKQEIFKINRGKAREKGGPLTKAEKGGKPVKEANQVKIAQQKDTLLDNNDRIVKDKVDKETSLDPVPTVESDKMIDKSIDGVFDNMIEKVEVKLVPVKETLKTVMDELQENWFDNIKAAGKKKMMQNRKKGLELTKKKDRAMKKVMKG